MVPLKEHTAEWCDMYVRAEPSWGEGGDDNA
jgi:hypothetical protein